MSKTAGTTGKGGKAEEELDLAALNNEKIKSLMQSDPKFITRMINQLDSQMKGILEEKNRKMTQIAADEAEIAQINATIASHIKPNLDKLDESIAQKQLLRDEAAAGLQRESKNLKDLEKDAAALIQAARSRSTKLFRKTAAQSLENSRGFNSSTPTTELLRGGSTTKKP